MNVTAFAHGVIFVALINKYVYADSATLMATLQILVVVMIVAMSVGNLYEYKVNCLKLGIQIEAQ